MSFIVKPEDRLVIKIENFTYKDIEKNILNMLSEKKRYAAEDALYRANYNLFDQIKGFARCSEDDTWDEKIGKDIAEQRVEMKKHLKIARIAKRCADYLDGLVVDLRLISSEHQNKADKLQKNIGLKGGQHED